MHWSYIFLALTLRWENAWDTMHWSHSIPQSISPIKLHNVHAGSFYIPESLAGACYLPDSTKPSPELMLTWILWQSPESISQEVLMNLICNMCLETQCGKLNFWSTRPKTDAPYMFYTKFHSPRPIFHSPSSKCICTGERTSISFSDWDYTFEITIAPCSMTRSQLSWKWKDRRHCMALTDLNEKNNWVVVTSAKLWAHWIIKSQN